MNSTECPYCKSAEVYPLVMVRESTTWCCANCGCTFEPAPSLPSPKYPAGYLGEEEAEFEKEVMPVMVIVNSSPT